MMNRRRWVAGAALAAAAAARSPAQARIPSAESAQRAPPHADFGPVVPPRPAPALPVRTSTSQDTDLPRLLEGRACAVQLMFTGCSATCPIQGAVFADTARRLSATGLEERSVRLLSLSIDPLGDSPAALHAWLRQHGATPLWMAAVPRRADGGRRMLDFLRAGRPGPDPHTGQVHVFDRQGRWVFKSADLPSSREIVGWLERVASQR